ncbi:GGDEF domain-containing protein [Mycoplana dimorpha]|uniref:diguanylate cyclase n=1 Tax=Mycoplana dimorpha TaxID=28320 RepID=A0A2T5AQW2_MYCDI|nr:GGDEF domain-containing protein [Mycoplana dimorpha]PTM89110.1 diguanylate cyclase (GGDEF)-like protein [Mycoplana dimorpha]
MKLDFSATSKARTYAGTIAAAIFVVSVSMLADLYNLNYLNQAYEAKSIEIAVLVPLFITLPVAYFIFEAFRRAADAREQLQRIASTDSLTKVLNRGAFTMLVNAYLEKAQQQASMQYGSMLVIDADHFKKINDTHGHQTGDDAFKVMARTIRQNVREIDLVGRIGGEEFCVFLPATRRPDAEIAAERIRETITKVHILSEKGGVRLSVSIGAASFQGLATYDQLFAAADRYAYQAKAGGRNRVVCGPLDVAA